ncbi:hypothetical protein RHMOL_Rhmol02G0174800 [Rhododendron molle]|uniref:Uncharacterized protein n=1 Tax=Rhododendron molle TaxID=49168 RepID=A0ACC0PSM8_RHOML|nr:hypothetical protein RHMOL_Rhmol02G0174800 [Rhododendron molle]
MTTTIPQLILFFFTNSLHTVTYPDPIDLAPKFKPSIQLAFRDFHLEGAVISASSNWISSVVAWVSRRHIPYLDTLPITLIFLSQPQILTTLYKDSTCLTYTQNHFPYNYHNNDKTQLLPQQDIIPSNTFKILTSSILWL